MSFENHAYHLLVVEDVRMTLEQQKRELEAYFPASKGLRFRAWAAPAIEDISKRRVDFLSLDLSLPIAPNIIGESYTWQNGRRVFDASFYRLSCYKIIYTGYDENLIEKDLALNHRQSKEVWYKSVDGRSKPEEDRYGIIGWAEAIRKIMTTEKYPRFLRERLVKYLPQSVAKLIKQLPDYGQAEDQVNDEDRNNLETLERWRKRLAGLFERALDEEEENHGSDEAVKMIRSLYAQYQPDRFTEKNHGKQETATFFSDLHSTLRGWSFFIDFPLVHESKRAEERSVIELKRICRLRNNPWALMNFETNRFLERALDSDKRDLLRPLKRNPAFLIPIVHVEKGNDRYFNHRFHLLRFPESEGLKLTPPDAVSGFVDLEFD